MPPEARDATKGEVGSVEDYRGAGEMEDTYTLQSKSEKQQHCE